VHTAEPQKNTATEQHLKKRYRERNVNSRFQLQLEAGGGLEVAAQETAGWRQVVRGLYSTGSMSHLT